MVPFLAMVVSADELHAQDLSDEESPLAEVFEGILLWHRLMADTARSGAQFLGAEQWGLVVGLFEAGESRAYRLDVTAGYLYRFAGAGDESVIDIDLCLQDDEGRETRCDETPNDARPVIALLAESGGTYEIVLHARALERSAHAGFIIMVTPFDADAAPNAPSDNGTTADSAERGSSGGAAQQALGSVAGRELPSCSSIR